MSGSTIAIIYGAVIALFFILLIVLTVTLIISKGKGDDELNDDDGYLDEEDDEEDEYDEEEDDIFASKAPVKKEVKPAKKSEDSIFDEADSAFADSAFSSTTTVVDSAFTDSAFADSVFASEMQVMDSAFSSTPQETKITDIDSAFDDIDEGADVSTIDLKLEEEYDKVTNASIPEESSYPLPEGDSAFGVEVPVETPVETSAIVEETSVEIPVEDSAIVEEASVETSVEDSAFVEEVPVQTPVEDSAFVEEIPVETPIEDSAFATEIPMEPIVGDSAFAEDSAFSDSAFGVSQISEEAIDQSVKEAMALSAAMTQPIPSLAIETVTHPSHGAHSKHRKPVVSMTDDFYWYNKMDVADKPSYKTAEMYYHHFNVPKDCIEELLMEMYDCALVRTEEIKYIAYGIEPRAVSMREILTSGNRNYTTQAKIKEPTTQDLVKIYEKWCGYVDKLFDKVEIHADDYTISEIRRLLCEFGRSDVDILIEGM